MRFEGIDECASYVPSLAWSLCNCTVFHHAPLTVSATSGSGSGGDNSGVTTSASLMARPGPGPLGSGHVVFSNCDREVP